MHRKAAVTAGLAVGFERQLAVRSTVRAIAWLYDSKATDVVFTDIPLSPYS